MGDMGDYYKDFKKDTKSFKERNMKENLDFLNKNKIDYTVYNNGYQLNFDVSFGIIAFYPTTNKWVFGKSVFYGNAETMMKWIKNHEIIIEEGIKI